MVLTGSTGNLSYVTSIRTTKTTTSPTRRASRLSAIRAITGSTRARSALAIDAAVATTNRGWPLLSAMQLAPILPFPITFLSSALVSNPVAPNSSALSFNFFIIIYLNWASIIGLRLSLSCFTEGRQLIVRETISLLFIFYMKYLVYSLGEPAPVNKYGGSCFDRCPRKINLNDQDFL